MLAFLLLVKDAVLVNVKVGRSAVWNPYLPSPANLAPYSDFEFKCNITFLQVFVSMVVEYNYVSVHFVVWTMTIIIFHEHNIIPLYNIWELNFQVTLQ